MPWHVSVSIGSLGKNRTTDMVENVRVDTCLLTNTTNGVRIKSWQVNTDTAVCSTHSDRNKNNLVRTTLTGAIRQDNTSVSEATRVCACFRAAWASHGTCGSRAS